MNSTLADPLELLPHVQFADTLNIAYIASKVQAAKIKPVLDLQFVIDYLPKLMTTGRPEIAKKLGQKPQPKIYMHLTNAELNNAEAFLEQVATVYLILLNNGRLRSHAELTVQVQELMKMYAEPIAGKAFRALQRINEAQEGIPQEATQ
jgi:hypothetical protein